MKKHINIFRVYVLTFISFIVLSYLSIYSQKQPHSFTQDLIDTLVKMH